MHNVTFHLCTSYCKTAFIWQIILMKNAWLTLILIIIFQFSIPPKVQNSDETERRNIKVKIHCKKTYLKRKRGERKLNINACYIGIFPGSAFRLNTGRISYCFCSNIFFLLSFVHPDLTWHVYVLGIFGKQFYFSVIRNFYKQAPV